MVAASGSFVLTGQDATLTKLSTSALQADSGTFTLTGRDAAFVLGRILSAGTGVFVLTGNAANLNKSVSASGWIKFTTIQIEENATTIQIEDNSTTIVFELTI